MGAFSVASLRSAALLSSLSFRLASLGDFYLLLSSRHSRLVLFCVFIPIGLIGLIGLIAPIGLIALGFLREELIGALGAASRRG